MSTVYRKSGSREFYKINEVDEVVTRVWNKQYFSRIDISVNRLIISDCRDEESTQPSTEEEFNTAYKEALARIQLGRLDI